MVDIIFAFIPLMLISVYPYWMLKLHADLKSGRRVRLKWKDLSLPKKLYGAPLVVYLVFAAYSDLTTLISIIIGAETEFLPALERAVTAVWLGTLGAFGFGFFALLRSPVQKKPLV